MHRMLAFVAALLVSALSISSACLAAGPQNIRFVLEDGRTDGRVHLDLRSGDRDGNNHMSSDFAPAQLAGLDLGALRAPGARPLRFALLRDAGRIDCAGQGGARLASGRCTFTADPRFADLMSRAGIARPTAEQAYGLTVLGTSRDLVAALVASRFPPPSVDDLLGMTALGVDRQYIDELARRGHRPRRTGELIEFKALGVTPAYIDGMRRATGGRVSASEIVQLKALDVTPEFVAGFARAGYPNLPASKLLELKAVGVTPEFARSLRSRGFSSLTPDQLVQMQVLGFDRPRRR